MSIKIYTCQHLDVKATPFHSPPKPWQIPQEFISVQSLAALRKMCVQITGRVDPSVLWIDQLQAVVLCLVLHWHWQIWYIYSRRDRPHRKWENIFEEELRNCQYIQKKERLKGSSIHTVKESQYNGAWALAPDCLVQSLTGSLGEGTKLWHFLWRYLQSLLKGWAMPHSPLYVYWVWHIIGV